MVKSVAVPHGSLSCYNLCGQFGVQKRDDWIKLQMLSLCGIKSCNSGHKLNDFPSCVSAAPAVTGE